MRTPHLAAASLAAIALSVAGVAAATLTTPDGRRDGTPLAIAAATPLGLIGPSLDHLDPAAIYAAPRKFTSAALSTTKLTVDAIGQMPFVFSVASG